MHYIFTIVFLFIAIIFYLKIANKFNIIDKPNDRSSHSMITIRGAGIIFYVASVTYFITSDFQYPWFFLGLTLLTYISFLDDIRGVNPPARLSVHLVSVLLMAYEFGIFNFPWYFLVLSFVFIVGVINAYNFMDGINGMTAFCTLIMGGLLAYVNTKVNYIEQDFLIYTLLGVVVFGFFNFRKKAVCFAGDVGPAVLSFMLVFALGKLILKTGDFTYILFLGVYGIEIGWSVARRVYQGHHIFEPHRTFLLHMLSNEVGYNSLLVSLGYGLFQLILGASVIYIVQFGAMAQWSFAIITLSGMSAFYLLLKQYIFNNYYIKGEERYAIRHRRIRMMRARRNKKAYLVPEVKMVKETKIIEMPHKENREPLLHSGAGS
ncbi:UDP-GlcNAc--UDP-phosphate GlcNAc-1-phosphate transferase [Sphingobacterium multivorum]|uniref:UDP-GlcNAc--UDP-phosphate GlcNAc-1-phosphate transferase n=1 Tax=Sphingobacterium multivorum TaxID=28454 RepID=UPI0028A89902|nr:UDP-GlcNAc--UDP-phosphate GlcNAc-1-phosphate transferase [Sphingobacterium multivorum]